MLDRFRRWYRSLPEKKQYLEFLTAALSVPVLITVIISNVNNLSKLREKETAVTVAPTSSQEKVIIITQKEQAKEESQNNKLTNSPTATPAPTSKAQCIKEVGPVKIDRPQEEEIITKEPFCLDLNYSDDRYCTVVVSSRLDGGSWSSFSSENICFQNLSVGKHSLELRVKSSASSDEVTLGRTFYFQAKDVPTATPTQAPTAAPTEAVSAE